MSNGDTSQVSQDFVPVTGPDGKRYRFPSGTTKDSAIAYFKKKGIGAAPSPALDTPPAPRKTGEAAPSVPAVQPSVTTPQKPLKSDNYFYQSGQEYAKLQGSISRWRPRWDDPKTLMQDPTWYGRSGKYLGGETIGAGKAVAGVATGGMKILNDTIAALDPREFYQPTEAAGELGRDLYGLAYGVVYDLPKAAYDLIRHFPESTSDPESLGNTVMNIAMTVDGGIKGAKAITEHLFPTQEAMLNKAVAATGAKTASQQAALTAYRASQSKVKDQIKWRAVADTYIHRNGVDVAHDIVKADTEAAKEVKVHVDNLSNIPKTEGVDAYQLAKSIVDAHKDIVQTPDPLNPTLSQLVIEAKKITPGSMPFEEARQFRSKIGAALQNAKGANKAVLGRAYEGLTKQLRGLAKKYSLEDSWDQYNELEAKRHKSFPLLEKAKQVVNENGEGAAMAQALRNEPAAKETIKSLAKYGLDENKITLYRKNANEILRTRPSENQRLTSYIYKWGPGTVPGLLGLGAGKALASATGAGSEGWIAGLGLGASAGAATVMLTEYLRAHRLSPQILSDMIERREWPGRIAPPKGKFPATTSEGEPAPQLPAAPSSGASPVIPGTTFTPPSQLPLIKSEVPPPPETPTGPTAQTATMPQPAAESTVAGRVVESMKQYHEGAKEAGKGAKPPKPYEGEWEDGSPKAIWKPQTEDPTKGFWEITKPPYSFERGQIALEATEGGSLGRKLTDAELSVLRKVKTWEQWDKLETQWFKKEPKVTKLAPEAGSRATKQRERVARVRKEKGSTALGGGSQHISGGGVAEEELKKAETRVNNPHIDASKMDVVDLERQLQGLDKNKFKEALALRKEHQLSSEDYRGVLEFYFTEAMEEKQNELE